MAQSIDASEEPENAIQFRSWFCENGGKINENIRFFNGPFGLSAQTCRDLPSGAVVASCPFPLAITLGTTQEALEHFCGLPSRNQDLTPRQLICAYVGLHYIIGEAEDENGLLRHRPYIRNLPKAEMLLTSLYFSETELDLFKGTNLYGATLEHTRICAEEHQRLREAIATHSPSISEKFTFEIYKSAWTYLSSRAFPSSLLSSAPSLEANPSSYPVLIPGVDLFNHKRAHPVSWHVSRAEPTKNVFPIPRIPDEGSGNCYSDLCISLEIETPTAEGEEVYNNYGPKPNSSLILAYGFALPDNPDDTILLKVGSNDDSGRSGRGVGHEVGRNASGAQAVWDDVRRIVNERYMADGHEERDDEESKAAYELQIDIGTVGILMDMVSSLIDRLPDLAVQHTSPPVREEVLTMWRYYVQGQRDILEALLDWLKLKDQEEIRRAEVLGISIVGDDSEEDE